MLYVSLASDTISIGQVVEHWLSLIEHDTALEGAVTHLRYDVGYIDNADYPVGE